MTKQSYNVCGIIATLTSFIGVFVAGFFMGIASIILGALATKGDTWAKTLGIVNIIIGIIYLLVFAFAFYFAMA